jgi:hypothetical protein
MYLKELQRFKPLSDLGYKVSNEDRIFTYVWDESGTGDLFTSVPTIINQVSNKNDKPKYGDHYVSAGVDPVEDILVYIRKELKRRKDLFDDGIVRVLRIWDVTEYAKSIDKFYKHSKVDDVIRPHIGHRHQGDVHNLATDELIRRVEDFLAKQGIAKPPVNLSSVQAKLVLWTKLAIMGKGGFTKKGLDRLLALVGARVGKTISSMAASTECNFKLNVITSYVKTSFTSFINDTNAFEQFKDIVHITAGEKDWESKVKTALEEDKRVNVYLSLCPGKKRQGKMDFIFGLPYRRFVIIDEADFGAHRKNQRVPLQNAVEGTNDVLFLMTGTDGDKAASNWKIDGTISIVYEECLVDKKESMEKIKNGSNPIQEIEGLDYFKRDLNRDLLYPSWVGFQMDLKSSVDKAIADGHLKKKLPSWSKFVANPIKGKGWYTSVLQGIFEGKGFDELNIDLQSQSVGLDIPERRIALMWFPGDTKTRDIPNLSTIANITQQSLSNTHVIDMSGRTTTNALAQAYVKEEIEKHPTENIIIVASKIGQRSWTVDIDEVYLCYDKGASGTTIQRISRVLSPRDENKVGKVISLSFNPNRDDKFDMILLQAAVNRKSAGIDINESLRSVLQSVQIFNCTDEGAFRIEEDEFIKAAMNKKVLSRVFGKAIPLEKLTAEQMEALAKGNISYFRESVRDAAETGDTRESSNRQSSVSRKKPKPSYTKKVREMGITLYEYSNLFLESAKPFGAKNIKESFEVIRKQNWEGIIEDQFGLDYDLIELFVLKVLNEDHINTLKQNRQW